MNSLFRGLVACLAVCVSASAAVSYVVANRSTGLYSIPSGATINSSVGGALDLAVDGGGNYIIATAVAIVRVTPPQELFRRSQLLHRDRSGSRSHWIFFI